MPSQGGRKSQKPIENPFFEIIAKITVKKDIIEVTTEYLDQVSGWCLSLRLLPAEASRAADMAFPSTKGLHKAPGRPIMKTLDIRKMTKILRKRT